LNDQIAILLSLLNLEANSIQPETSPEDMSLLHFLVNPTFVHLNATIVCSPKRPAWIRQSFLKHTT